MSKFLQLSPDVTERLKVGGELVAGYLFASPVYNFFLANKDHGIFRPEFSITALIIAGILHLLSYGRGDDGAYGDELFLGMGIAVSMEAFRFGHPVIGVVVGALSLAAEGREVISHLTKPRVGLRKKN